jgi:AhpD family alkylhydroperoxidase
MKRPRIANPVLTVPGALQALMAFSETATHPGLPRTTLELVNLRVSQINGCSVCVEMHSQGLKQAGESDARLFAVAAWRDSSVFSDAERAALALAEAATRISDRPDPVPDDIFVEAARHYDEPALARLVIDIAGINAWNRLNVTTGQIAGQIPAPSIPAQAVPVGASL